MEFFNLFTSLDPYLYSTVFHKLVLGLCIFTFFINVQSSETISPEDNSSSIVPTFILALILIIFLGMRPVWAVIFGDSYMYAHHYVRFVNDFVPLDLKTEWFWENIAVFLKNLGFSTQEYFLVIAFLYIFCMLIACYLIFHQSTWLPFLFCISAFSFYGYAVNGLRNGMACSIVMMAIALFSKEKKVLNILSLFLCFLAFGIHRSVILPISAMLATRYLIKDYRYALGFWIASIAVSLVAGETVSNFFASLGFDSRLAGYINNHEYDDMFSSTGFRWDFLLYSMVPIAIGYYIITKKGIVDRTYVFLLSTYIISNSFWIMVIRASNSNRFAYLSWFLYPIVIAYPLLKIDFIERQRLITVALLVGYAVFSFYIYS